MKIAYLFLTTAQHHHESYWRDFFADGDNRYSIYAHAKEKITPGTLLEPYVIPEQIPTTWANTMRAQQALLKEALKDPDNQKFIFISETTIPLVDFKTVYRQLMSHNKSMFRYWRNPHPHRFNTNAISYNKQLKNWQWIVLNRAHAQIIAHDTTYINIFDSVTCDNEHYPSIRLVSHHQQHHMIMQKNTTYVVWPSNTAKHPYTFTDFNDKKDWELITAGINKKLLFARKIAPQCKHLDQLDTLLAYRHNH
jgi:hypothetical protein